MYTVEVVDDDIDKFANDALTKFYLKIFNDITTNISEYIILRRQNVPPNTEIIEKLINVERKLEDQFKREGISIHFRKTRPVKISDPNAVLTLRETNQSFSFVG